MTATIEYLNETAVISNGLWVSDNSTVAKILNAETLTAGAFWTHGGDPNPDYSIASKMVEHLGNGAKLLAFEEPEPDNSPPGTIF